MKKVNTHRSYVEKSHHGTVGELREFEFSIEAETFFDKLFKAEHVRGMDYKMEYNVDGERIAKFSNGTVLRLYHTP